MRIGVRKNWLKNGISLLSIIILIWLGGFGIFIYRIPHQVSDKLTATEGVVVLTGRKGRVKLGFDLVQQGLGEKLLITGVHHTVNMSSLLNGQQIKKESIKNNISTYLGYKATNTYGNAQETAAWIKEQNIHSVRLVTTNYHMRRSLLHFQQCLPANTLIIPHPIEEHLKWDAKTLYLLWTEYHKLLRDYLKYTRATSLKIVNR